MSQLTHHATDWWVKVCDLPLRFRHRNLYNVRDNRDDHTAIHNQQWYEPGRHSLHLFTAFWRYFFQTENSMSNSSVNFYNFAFAIIYKTQKLKSNQMKYFSFGAEEETGVRYIHVKF